MKRVGIVCCLLLAACCLLPALSEALTINASISWSDVANEDQYLVERANVSGGPYTQIGTTNAGVTAYVDSGLAMATTYCYRIKASNAYGQSAPSNEACGTTGTTPPPPGGVTVTITVVP